MIPIPHTATPALQCFVVNPMRSGYALVAAFAKDFKHKPTHISVAGRPYAGDGGRNMEARTFRISGRVVDVRGQGMAGLQVQAWDKDLKYDDMVGEDITKSDG